MRSALKISAVLTWINLIFWGLGCLQCLLLGVTGNPLFLLSGFIISAIVLHSYAALRLHRSIRNPAVPLSSQTPSGIRFIGFVSLFISTLFIVFGIALIKSAHQVVPMLQENAQFKDISEKQLRLSGIQALVLGLSVAVNVLINLRLLRWYYLSRDSNNIP
ncbi:hypothetical protein Q4E93_01050 [Flavitalea sp. BT771]|uniref:hypothetical protein n=1 Tax=Flavitalea sp. BT771 TaxID=3063329 RepID=UPI0026E2AC7E|nr:hypothetical protein [Flavitalea sp. BT771]MDO6429153.1 hypothetical protein [Flavitalea sp. BT771]MDV6218719.1 hypothetical protein [Flavitalea sp. BT771]